MNEHIEKALRYIAAMRVDGENQELAVAAKNELRQAMKEHEFVPNRAPDSVEAPN